MPDTAQSVHEGPMPADPLSDEDQDLFAKQAHQAHRLGFSLLSSIPGNCVLSPQGVGVLLAMLAHVTSRHRLDKISELSGVDPVLLGPRESSSPHTPMFIDTFHGAVFGQANAAWFDRGLESILGFLRELAGDFGINTRSFDASLPDEAAHSFNQWATENAYGTLGPFVTPEAFQPFALILANTAAFRGSWPRPFHRSQTKNRCFHCSDGSVVSVPTMAKREAWLGYLETDEFQAVELPYAGGQCGLFVILPKETSSVEAVTRCLSQESHQSLTNCLEAVCGDLRLPRFDIQWQSGLNKALKAAGLGAVLDTKHSFPGASEGPLGQSMLMHQALLCVDEGGSEATALTADALRTGVRKKWQKKRFKMYVDRPFLFALYQNDLPGPLLVGRVEKLEHQESNLGSWRNWSEILGVARWR